MVYAAAPDPARLFLAVWPTPATREALAACRDAQRWPEGSAPTADDRLHLTLHFLGDVPRRRVTDVSEGLIVAFEPFEMALDRVEVWPNGVAALRPLTAPIRLMQLHAALRTALQRLDVPTETRAFRPHVTLARRAGDAGITPPAEPLRWRVREYALVESRRGVGGGYQVLRRYL